ncbi:hypothetical protein GCM10007962_13440 [Yeosuana aromativorans]|uniref:HEPN domain-containing protein n=1 Tax=Yeosuana aromativorans TaxID=288019 RepID=A0A8J3FIT2_9FLAO|nr:hypothetical protein [Yeosuana aromativorans]GGK20647.1 hypothetical protein GCM10007962_13440 [Yeosuana aromativorans]
MGATSVDNISGDDPKQLNEVIAKIVEAIDVEGIYLNKGTSRNLFRYRINIIMGRSLKVDVEHIMPVINSVFLDYEDFGYRVFTFSHAQSELLHGNLYFLNNCHKKYLVYKTTQNISIWNYPKEEPPKLFEKIKQDFKRDMSRMKSFKKGIQFFRAQRSLSQSAFMMHQTFEQGYRILERFICGKTKICHSIKNHQTYVLNSLNELQGMFLPESDAETGLLDLLEDAYSSARYSHSYKITDRELDQLSQKLGSFIKEIKSLFNEELSVFMETIVHDNVNPSSEHPLEEPTNNHESDYLVRKLEFDNPFEMLCMAKSLMVLSVTCLQDDVAPPIQMNGFHCDIMEVLHLAIELLPLKETSP